MRQGNDAKLVLNNKSEILAISTGSDATAEHEWGSKTLMQEMTGAEQFSPVDIGAKLLSGALTDVPQIFESRKILANLEELVFLVGEEDGAPVAVLGYSARGPQCVVLNHSELRLRKYAVDPEVAGAWDESSFGFKVRGEKLVKRLERFYKALMAGHGMFCGLFMKDADGGRLAGVSICNVQHMRPEHRAAMYAEQTEFEEKCMLRKASRERELNELARTHKVNPGHIWPLARANFKHLVGAEDQQVVYGLTPSNDRSADYYGPYTFDELSTWISSGLKGKLKPQAMRQLAPA